MKKNIICLVLLLILFGICGCAKKEEDVPAWQEQYDLGVRYLSEGNYEQAIIAFRAAIKIDPKQAVVYEGLASAYLGVGDYESAFEIFEEGFLITGEKSLSNQLEELMKLDIWNNIDKETSEETEENISENTGNQTDKPERNPYSGNIEEDISSFIWGEMLSLDEIPLYMISIYDVPELLPESSLDWGIRDHGDLGLTYDVSAQHDENNYGIIEVKQADGWEHVTKVRYQDWLWEGICFALDCGIRGIKTGDSAVEVLKVLGFTENGAKQLEEDCMSVHLDVKSGDYYSIQKNMDSWFEIIYLFEDEYIVSFSFEDGKLHGVNYGYESEW